MAYGIRKPSISIQYLLIGRNGTTCSEEMTIHNPEKNLMFKEIVRDGVPALPTDYGLYAAVKSRTDADRSKLEFFKLTLTV